MARLITWMNQPRRALLAAASWAACALVFLPKALAEGAPADLAPRGAAHEGQNNKNGPRSRGPR